MIVPDAPFVEVAKKRPQGGSVMFCLYTGLSVPPYCSPMRRVPSPPIGMRLDLSLKDHISHALSINASVHDGALMIGRTHRHAPYVVSGWSYRLHPPEPDQPAAPNRGSAYNSCLAMSVLAEVDLTYLLSGSDLLRFEDGVVANVGT